MNTNVQELNFLDVTSLGPEEQQRVNDILFGQRCQIIGKVEFPWGNTDPNRYERGDEGVQSSPSDSAQSVPSLPPADRQTEQTMSSIMFSYDKKSEVENLYTSNSKAKEQSADRYAGKPYERRNKKRRPPDYYQKYDEAAQTKTSLVTDQPEENRPLMWHEEVEQSLPLPDTLVDSAPSVGGKTPHIQINQTEAGSQGHRNYSAHTDRYPQHQNFSANFHGNVSVDQLISKQPEFIPSARTSEKTHNNPSNIPHWQQPTQKPGNVYDSSMKQCSQFNVPVSNHNTVSFQNMPSSMHYSGTCEDSAILAQSASMKPQESRDTSDNVHSVTESQNFNKLPDHFSVMSLQKPLKNVTEVVSDNSSSSHPGSKESLSVNPESISDSLSFVPTVSSQKLSDPVLNEDIEFMGPSLAMDNDSQRSDLDPDQYPVLSKMSGASSEETPKDSSQGPTLPSTSPQSVPEEAAKPKSASWAGLFSNIDPAKQGYVVTTWAPTPSNHTSKPQESSQTEPRVLSAPVDVSEDPLAKSFGDSLSRMKISHVPIGLQPRGLMNRGNWCYINATLQALVSCPPFYNMMKKFPVNAPARKGKSSTPIMDSLVQFVHEFHPCARPTERGRKTLTELVPGPAFEPVNVYNMLQVIEENKSFKLGKQEDAEEFLSYILDGLHEEMTTLIKFANGTPTGPDAVNGLTTDDVSLDESSEDVDPDSWEQVGPKKKSVLTRRANFEKTPLAEIFVGYTRSALYKANSKDSATLQPFFTLQLDIQSDKVHSVKEAMDGLVSRESVSGFTCSKTKAEVDVVRHLTLEELPPVLILHLKFFVYDKDGGSQKLLKNFEYGIDLEITKDLLSPNVRSKYQLHQRSYKLFAVVYHHGKKATGGHYTTAVFHPAINNWIIIDDSLVKHVSVGTVLKNIPGRVPYLLYYRRIDMH